MANSYLTSRWTWKRAKKLFFLLFDLAVLKHYILPFRVMGRKFHRDFRLVFLTNMLVMAAYEQRRPACRENIHCFCKDGASVSTGLVNPNRRAVVSAL